jgi:colicin import membrane protein
MPKKAPKLTAEQEALLKARKAEAAAGAPAGPSNAEKRAAAKARQAEAAAREAAAEAAKAEAHKKALEDKAEEVRQALARARINGQEKRTEAAAAAKAAAAAAEAQAEADARANRARKKAIANSERSGMSVVKLNKLRGIAEGNTKRRKTRRNRK